MKIVFWLSFGVLFYVYFGYPLLLFILSKIRRKQHKIDENYAPPVSLIIPAYNEEEVIEAKLKNSLALEYPSPIEIILASDGSVDRTPHIARRFFGVTLRDFKVRKGKMAILNEVVSGVKNGVIIFTDANALFKKDAIKKLVRHIADPEVGCVGGVKRIVPNGKVGEHEKVYWGFESFLKAKESEIGSSFVDGAIYALKREFYPFPNHNRIIMDDFAVSLGVINKNRRVVFEPEAIAYETASIHGFDEFRRKVRILKGAITAIRDFSIKSIFFQIISHKILRWFSCIFMITLLGSSLFIKGGFYYLSLLFQTCFYGLALAGLGFECLNKKAPKLFYAPFYFCLASLAQVVGFIKYLNGEHAPFWEKIRR